MDKTKKNKLSRYNIIKNIDEKTIVYNTASGAILALNKEYSDSLNDLINTGTTSKSDLCKELSKGDMLLSDDVNELDKLLILNKMILFDKNNLTFLHSIAKIH